AVGVHDVDLATEIGHATRRERDLAPVVRPVGPRVVTWDIGQLRLLGAVPLHDEDVEETRAVTAESQQLTGESSFIEPPLGVEREIETRLVGTHRPGGARDEQGQHERQDARDWSLAHDATLLPVVSVTGAI